MKRVSPFREHVYTVAIPNIAGYKIHYVFTTNVQKSWLKRFSTIKFDELSQADALHQGTAGGHSWLFYPEGVGVSTMVHECWHSVYALLNWAGIPLDNNELVAYTLGFVVSRGQGFQIKNDVRIKYQKQLKLKRKS